MSKNNVLVSLRNSSSALVLLRWEVLPFEDHMAESVLVRGIGS